MGSEVANEANPVPEGLPTYGTHGWMILQWTWKWLAPCKQRIFYGPLVSDT